MKEFNITGICIPQRHYMADITHKLDEIAELVNKGKYFTINRSRQYGKTTTLYMLEQRLSSEYEVLSVSFEGMSEKSFLSSRNFVKTLISKVSSAMEYTTVPDELKKQWKNTDDFLENSDIDDFEYLSKKITLLCRQSDKNIVLMVDEVDKSSDNQIFLNFLGMLRDKYLQSAKGRDNTFKSVILAGVYDIKNLKLKIRSDEEKKYNSPWNVAVDFKVDMSFSPQEIAAMLEDYEKDYHTGMDIKSVSDELYFLTDGYPYLVSWLCKWIDEEENREFTRHNIQKAEKAIHFSDSTLIDDVIKNYENEPMLGKMIDEILFEGKKYPFVRTDTVVNLGVRLGIFSKKDDSVGISNIIFEKVLMDHILLKKARENSLLQPEKKQFVHNGKLDMEQVLTKFQQIMKSEYRSEDGKFI